MQKLFCPDSRATHEIDLALHTQEYCPHCRCHHYGEWDLFFYTYFKPDLRYEEGSYYRSGDRAITSLKLQNYGHGDAEEIRIGISFPDSILDVTTSDESLPIKITSGGIGSKSLSGTLPRLVPDEVLYIYFGVRNPDGHIPASYEKFINPKGIVYKGGIAKEGKPFPWILVGLILAPSILFNIVMIGIILRSYFSLRRSSKTLDGLTLEAREMIKTLEGRLEEVNRTRALASQLMKSRPE